MIKVATVFSGIGAIEQALKMLDIDHKIIFACDNGERDLDVDVDKIMVELEGKNNSERRIIVDKLYEPISKKNFVQQSYLANYDLDPSKFYQDARFLDGTEYKGEIDLFVGGSPCQSFSINGHRKGLEDARGTLFYDFARLVKESQPKVFIYENVPGMLSHDNGNTFEVVTQVFNDLNYDWKLEKLNSRDFGIPQRRNRLFVVGIRKDLKHSDFNFPIAEELTKKVSDYLDDEVDEKYYYAEKGFKWITKDSSLKRRVSINSNVSRTQSANQQFNWCGDMVFYPLSKKEWAIDHERIYIGEYKNEKGVARKMTPRECLRLMGFPDDFKIVVPDKEMYRQSGNSIVVNILKKLLLSIIETGVYEING